MRRPDLDTEARDDDDAEGEGIDLESAREIAAFFFRAPRRKPKLALASFASVMALTVGAAVYWPRTYAVDVRILAEQNLILPALGNPNRAVPRDADKPTRNIADTILRRENIVLLAKELNLPQRWETDKPAAMRVRDQAVAFAFGPLTEEEKMRALIGLLEKRLMVSADDTSVTISIEWPHPMMAFDLVSTIEKSFLDARYDSNAAEIGDAIAILQQRAKAEAPNVDVALSELITVENDAKSTPPPATVSGASGSQVVRAAPAVAASSVDARVLGETRQQIRRIEDERQRLLSETNNQLLDAQSSLGPLHPTVLALRQKLLAVQTPPPELGPLKAEERALVARIANAASSASSPEAPPNIVHDASPKTAPRFAMAPLDRGTSADRTLPFGMPLIEDGPTARARAKLTLATGKYNDVLGRLEAAEMELDVSRAAFKYKYSIVRPAEIPRTARKPRIPVIVGGGTLAAIVLTLLLCGFSVLARGRFVERWQVERRLKMPILGELSLPAPSDPS